ncbi:MAG: hypothetical protein JSV16_11565 [Candidatus Hydrogenedentota bacterium]|nr:MAG: hypothetical protein JSV16_11565 [Candidatus Hydrogenedentota bacterium]
MNQHYTIECQYCQYAFFFSEDDEKKGVVNQGVECPRCGMQSDRTLAKPFAREEVPASRSKSLARAPRRLDINLRKNIKLELDFFEEVTKFLAEQHKGLRGHISLKKNEPRTVIYFIFARVIAHCNAAHRLIEDGYNHEAIVLLKDAYEALGLARYFATVDEKNRFFRTWVEAREKQETMSSFALRDRPSDSEMTDETRQIVSKYMNLVFGIPTYHTMRETYNRTTREFDYKGVPGHRKLLIATSILNQVLISCLQELMICFAEHLQDAKTVNRIKDFILRLTNRYYMHTA